MKKYAHLFHAAGRIASDILFPPLCIRCGIYAHDTREPLCMSCSDTITRHTSLICPICTARLANNRRTCRHSKKLMAQFPYLLGAATSYTDPVTRTCVHACKYQRVHALTPLLARLLVTYVQSLHPQPHIIDMHPIVVPIPIHSAKERSRGFNQSALIARSFAQVMHMPYDELLIKQTNNNPLAQEKTHQQRFDHMRNAFVIPRPRDVHGKNIILIDDVSTSGATLAEASRTLKTAGAKHILALVIAKA